MTNKYKKEREEYNRRIYGNKSLPALKIIGKKKGLLNVDQYKKADKNVLVERLVKGKQLNDYPKNVLLEKAQNEGLSVNASLKKQDILKKISNPELKDLNKIRLRKLAESKGVQLADQLTKDEIIERLENPTKHYKKQKLKRLARDNNINVRETIKKQDLINILVENNIITNTPITAQESNLGVAVSSVPIELIRKAKKKAQSAREALINFKDYIKNLKSYNISADRLKKLTKQLERKEKKAKEEHDRIFTPTREASAFRNYTNQYVMYNTVFGYPPLEFLEDAIPAIINIFNSNRNIKTILYLHCFMAKTDPITGAKVIKEFAFHSKGLKLVLEGTDENDLYNEMVGEIEEEIQKTEMTEGSGWVFLNVKKLVLHTTRWDPINAGSYIEVPAALKNKKALINMKNQDEECLKWTILRALYPKNKNAERIDSDLKSKQDTINMEGIRYPANFRDIDRFESQNPNISISVLGYNKEERVYPLRISKYTRRKHDIVLLLLKGVKKGENGEEKENSHYVLVKNISALLASQINNHDHKRHFCLNCFNSFQDEDKLKEHKDYCYENECVKILMPPSGIYLRFKNFLHSEKAPFAIYADFESKIIEMDNCNPDPNKSYTKKYQKHEPVSFCYYIKSFNESVYESRIRSYIKETPEGEDVIDVFIKWLEDDVKAIANIKPKKMIFTEEDKKHFNKASDCWICGEDLGNDRVRDHCHFTGRYRGPAHNSCNLKYRKPNNISVFFHNLSGYDSHLFIQKNWIF